MAVIKKSSAPRPAAKSSPPKPPAGKSEGAKKPAEAKPESKLEKKSETNRETKPSDKPEVGNGKPTAEAGALDENGKPIKDPNAPEQAEDPEDRFEASAELEEDPEKEEMREELQSLKDALAALYDQMGADDEEKAEAASESPGGCCGKPSGAKQAGDSQGNQDWNTILAAGVAAVKAQGLGQPKGERGGLQAVAGAGAPGGGAPRAGAPEGGAPGAGANAATLGGGKPGADPLSKLSSDYQKAKAANAQLKPEIENEVRSLLGLPVEDKAGAASLDGSSPLAGLAKAS